MASGIELILATICLNATCIPLNNNNNITLDYDYTDTTLNHQQSSLINNNEYANSYLIDPNTPFNKSIEVKHKRLMKLRNWLNGQNLKIATLEDYPLSYTEIENGTIYGRGISFELVNFLAKKFNFTYDIIIPDNNIIGSPNDMDGSLLELMNRTVKKRSLLNFFYFFFVIFLCVFHFVF